MTVRTSAPIVFEPSKDFLRTDRGITWGIKVTNTGDLKMVHVFEKSGDTWTVGAQLAGLDWPDQLTQYGGDVREWFIAKVLPLINAWLASRFPALDAAPSDDPSAQLDRLIVGSLKITVGPDGTLKASI